jgi:hypothetical protein
MQLQTEEDKAAESDSNQQGPISPNNTTPASSVSETPTSWLDTAGMKKGCLDPGLTFENTTHSTAPFESVFITGVTGFVGAFITRELLELRVVVHCLVRTDDEKQAMQRLVTTFADYGLWKPGYAPLVHVVLSEMAQPLCGLSRDAFEDLTDRVDDICHLGALVNRVRPLDDFVGPNIISTHGVLRLAFHGRGKAVNLISTVSTIPLHQ